MRRHHLVELHELPWFPAAWRDPLTDFLAFYATYFQPYARVPELLADALRSAGTDRVVDLCSGGGPAVLAVKPALDAALGAPVCVTLTDRYPNLDAFAVAAERFPEEVGFVAQPVDAAAVPEELRGFRTLFSSFHHFPPATARAILADAADKGCGLAVLEYTERRPLVWALPLLLSPALVWVTTPLIRPMTWRRLLWTYLVPVVPLVVLWDGLVSVLRSYTPAELEALTAGLAEGYRWQVGRLGSLGASRVTYLIGVPGQGSWGSGGITDEASSWAADRVVPSVPDRAGGGPES